MNAFSLAASLIASFLAPSAKVFFVLFFCLVSYRSVLDACHGEKGSQRVQKLLQKDVQDCLLKTLFHCTNHLQLCSHSMLQVQKKVYKPDEQTALAYTSGTSYL